MKKFLVALTLTCLTTGLVTLNSQQAAAENWLKLYQGETDTLYFDSDSFIYDAASNTVSFWEKYLDEKDDSNIQTRRCYNYNDKTFAAVAINSYRENKLVSSNTYPEAEYKPIQPNSVGENNYNFFEYVNHLSQQNIEWNFNKVFINTPAKLDSNSWKPKPNLPHAYYDTSSYRYDKQSNTETFWVQSRSLLGGKNCIKLTYYQHNLSNDKFAWVAAESFVEGYPTAKTIYPILIWHRAEVIRKDAYDPSVDFFNQGLLILNRGIKE